MDTRLKKLKWNSQLALLYQAILVVSGFVLPRCILHFYGSEINGLIASITQVLSFINICDLGISAVVSSALYAPLANRDYTQVSKVFVFAKKFFRIIGFILVAYVVVLMVLFPTLVNDSFDPLFTCGLIGAMCISHFGQYFLGINYQLLLNSDQRSYVQLIINGSTLLLNVLCSVLFMYLGAGIHFVKLSTSLIYLLRPLLMYCYVKKRYPIDHTVKYDPSVVPQKKNGIIQHIAYTIYENTDIFVLTVCSTLSNVSVYSVYTLATNSVRLIIGAATTGLQALFGNMIAKGEKDELRRAYSVFHWAIHSISVLLFTVTGLLIVPFVLLYTRDVHDADYYAPLFACLITVAYFFNSIRSGMYNTIRAAGHYKQTQAASLLEAILNIVLSLILVFRYGLVGVAIGTIAAALFFTVYEAIYLSKHIVHFPLLSFFKQLLADILSVGLMLAATLWITVHNTTFFAWIASAILCFLLCLLVSVIIQLIFYPKYLRMISGKVIGIAKRILHIKR